jgi:hypothetical protein
MAVLQSTSITGGLVMHGMSVGFMRLNASGAVVIDTNTYVTGGPYLPTAGGTISGVLTISTIEDGKLVLRAPAGDTSQWNYINFVGTDGVRDAYLGTDGGGNPQWWRDDNSLRITLGSVATINDVQIVTNSGTWGINVTGTAGSETLATVTGRGATTTSAVTFNAGITVNGTAYYTFSKPSTSSYQTVALFGTGAGGIFITSDNAIISKGAYYNNGWIATATAGSLIDLTANSNNPGIATFSGATVGSGVTFSATYKIWHEGNLTNLNQLTNGPGYITSSGSISGSAGSVPWSGVSTGYRTNYDLGFRPADNSSSYAGFRFATPGNDADAGYFLIRGGADSDVYTQDGITLVADKGWLTLAQRTTASKGVRIMTGTTSVTRLQIDSSGNTDVGLGAGTVTLYHGGASRFWTGSDGTRTQGWAYFQNTSQGLHWPGNNWHLHPASASDFIIRSGSNTDSALRFDTNGTTRGYVYAENDNTIGFLTNSRNWAFRTYSNGNALVYGYLTVNGAGTSSSIYMNDSDNGQREIHCNSDRIGFLTQAGNWGAWLYDGADWEAASSVRAPIFYDSNDTTYYLDPNSSSRLRYLYVGDGGSNWSNPGGWDTTLYISGVNHAIIRVENRQNNYHSALHSHTGQLPGVGSPGDYDFRITRNWSNRMVFYTGYTYSEGYLQAADSLRAPIFYDSQDTTYYLDLNSSSDSALRIRGGALFGANSTWGKYLYVGTNGRVGATATVAVTNGNLHIDCEDGYALYLNWYSTNNIYSRGNFGVGSDSASYRLHVHGTGYATSDFRAPIFYDSENTAYYGDFASTSRLNVLDANSIYTSGGLSTNGGNSLLGVQSPGGASRANGGSTETGAFKITFPAGIPVYGMFKLVIHIYEYGQRGNGYEIHCGGHMYPNYMYNRFQVQYGSSNTPLNVRYGNDGTYGCIWIGNIDTTWSYPQIWVSEFMMGYSNTSWTTWRSGWNISLVTSYGNSGAMDGPYTCDYGYAASAGSASTSSQVTINYNDNSNANYQLLWGSGNNVYGTGGVYVNPADDRVYANYFSSAYYMDVYTSAGSDYLRITDNQVYRPNGGILYLNWSSNANVALTGPSGGNVGVGNNSPSYKMHVSGDIYANGGWLRVSGSSGLYFESYAGGWHMQDSSYMRAYNGKSVHMNGGSVDYVGSLYLESGGQGVHLQPNTGSYGSLQVTNSRGGWHGIRFTGSNVNLMVNTTEVGFHNNASGWQMRWESGTGYVHKGSTGGGTSATILDSSNYTSWAAPRSYLDGLSVGFHVYGDANTYYPILISAHGHFGMHRYSISRSYSDTAPWDPISTGSHKGGLTLTFDWSSDIAWGGNDKSYRIIQFAESYTTMVAGMALPVTGGMLVWLRGGGAGGAFYRLHTPGGLTASATAYMSGYTAANGAFYGIRTDTSNVNSEIRSRFPVRDSGNSDMYVNNNIVLHAGNYNSYSPTLTGGNASGTWSINITGNSGYASSAGNADTVDGFHAAAFPYRSGNTTGYYQVADWMQFNTSAGLYWPSYYGAHFYPNNYNSYTQFRLDGSKNGYGGIVDSYSAVAGIMYDSGGNGGVYREANSRWYMYYHLGNDCMGIGTSSTNSGYSVYSNKGHFVNLSGSNVSGFYNYHSGGISSGAVVNAFTAEWTTYGASFNIVYKQGELSPSDMCHIYNQGGFYMKIFDGSSNRFHRWDDNGAVSINSSSQGSYTFNVTGDIYATADVIAFSDARVKEDVRTVENALDKVTKLRGVTYIKKDEENKKRKMGVIAQEVLEVLPEVVHEDNDGYYGVSYGNIVGVLIEAIKEQQKQIDELKQELKNK